MNKSYDNNNVCVAPVVNGAARSSSVDGIRGIIVSITKPSTKLVLKDQYTPIQINEDVYQNYFQLFKYSLTGHVVLSKEDSFSRKLFGS